MHVWEYKQLDQIESVWGYGLYLDNVLQAIYLKTVYGVYIP